MGLAMNEVWKNIEGYNGLYQVSSFGRVRSWKNGRWGKSDKPKILKQGINNEGRCNVSLEYKSTAVHRLVAETFIPNPSDKPEVNHKDGDPSNNHVSNLEWCTPSENIKHSYRVLKRKHAMSSLGKKEVLEIRAAWPLGCFTQKEIGEAYGIGQDQVSRIVNNKAWRHI